jgi:hypothetical protein
MRIEPASSAGAPRGYFAKFMELVETSLASRYMQANVVYLLYTSIIIYINSQLAPRADDAYADDVCADPPANPPPPLQTPTLSPPSPPPPPRSYYGYADDGSYFYRYPDDTLYRMKLRSINQLYIAAGVIHLFNAFQYIFAWLPLGYGLLHPVMIPEYLNVLGAALYLASASKYNETLSSYTSDTTKLVHRIETASSFIEVLAAVGWTVVWWKTHARGRGRGLTVDDPDFWGNVFIVVPSVIYFVYNVQNLKDPEGYGTNYLFTKGDTLYFVGSLFYILCALRDDGWFDSFVVGGALFRGLGLAWLWERACGRCCSCEVADSVKALGEEGAYGYASPPEEAPLTGGARFAPTRAAF